MLFQQHGHSPPLLTLSEASSYSEARSACCCCSCSTRSLMRRPHSEALVTSQCSYRRLRSGLEVHHSTVQGSTFAEQQGESLDSSLLPDGYGGWLNVVAGHQSRKPTHHLPLIRARTHMSHMVCRCTSRHQLPSVWHTVLLVHRLVSAHDINFTGCGTAMVAGDGQ